MYILLNNKCTKVHSPRSLHITQCTKCQVSKTQLIKAALKVTQICKITTQSISRRRVWSLSVPVFFVTEENFLERDCYRSQETSTYRRNIKSVAARASKSKFAIESQKQSQLKNKDFKQKYTIDLRGIFVFYMKILSKSLPDRQKLQSAFRINQRKRLH